MANTINQKTIAPTNLGAVSGNHKQGLFGHMESGSERSLYRRHLAKAFGNLHNSGLKSSPSLFNQNILGPFRTNFNAGDVVTNNIENTDIKYGRQANQVGGNNLSRVQRGADGSGQQNGNAMYSGNPRFVHDGSDYIRFKKLSAINYNFNDNSHGGASGNNTQHALRRVRR